MDEAWVFLNVPNEGECGSQWIFQPLEIRWELKRRAGPYAARVGSSSLMGGCSTKGSLRRKIEP